MLRRSQVNGEKHCAFCQNPSVLNHNEKKPQSSWQACRILNGTTSLKLPRRCSTRKLAQFFLLLNVFTYLSFDSKKLAAFPVPGLVDFLARARFRIHREYNNTFYSDEMEIQDVMEFNARALVARVDIRTMPKKSRAQCPSYFYGNYTNESPIAKPRNGSQSYIEWAREKTRAPLLILTNQQKLWDTYSQGKRWRHICKPNEMRTYRNRGKIIRAETTSTANAFAVVIIRIPEVESVTHYHNNVWHLLQDTPFLWCATWIAETTVIPEHLISI
mmetsp:Transcript_4619/g.10857  ORF Transcript_4619/g.10857 Transcript_4619/m.10857 type:complete len:273 (-) Transcript_4619:985-1803(-)